MLLTETFKTPKKHLIPNVQNLHMVQLNAKNLDFNQKVLQMPIFLARTMILDYSKSKEHSTSS